MADIEWPKGLTPYKTMFYLQPHVGGQESPLTRTRKVYGLSAPRWVARLTFRAGHGFDPRDVGYYGPHGADPAFYAARLDALIAQLQGGLHCVRFADWRRLRPQAPSSDIFPRPPVDAAPAGATFVIVRTRPGYLGPSVGDYIGGDGRPHIVTAVWPANGSMTSGAGADGAIRVEFQPPLSSPVAQGQPLIMGAVDAPFRLVSEDAGQNEAAFDAPIDYVLDFVEDLR